MNPALFLDRDGVIIHNRSNYVRSWEDVEIYPQALDALAKIAQSPYSIIIVTNQSAVGRGLVSLNTAQAINQQLVEKIEEIGGRIDGVYMCPHAPWEGCDCRKPEPGLFFQAAADHSIDLGRSIMIGDALTDILAARTAGVSRQVLVRTGRGLDQVQLPEAANLQPLTIYDDLSSALEAIVQSIDSPASR